MNTLRAMLDAASPWVADRFAKQGRITPMWHVVEGDGTHTIKTDIHPDKDTESVLMRAYFYLVRARRYLFIDEAWMAAVLDGDPDRIATVHRYASLGKLSDYPDRREAIMFAGEDTNGDSVLAHRFILRPEHGKATLAPLEIREDVGDSYGRFTHMLQEQR
jgi:hypothetical protein